MELHFVCTLVSFLISTTIQQNRNNECTSVKPCSFFKSDFVIIDCTPPPNVFDRHKNISSMALTSPSSLLQKTKCRKGRLDRCSFNVSGSVILDQELYKVFCIAINETGTYLEQTVQMKHLEFMKETFPSTTLQYTTENCVRSNTFFVGDPVSLECLEAKSSFKNFEDYDEVLSDGGIDDYFKNYETIYATKSLDERIREKDGTTSCSPLSLKSSHFTISHTLNSTVEVLDCFNGSQIFKIKKLNQIGIITVTCEKRYTITSDFSEKIRISQSNKSFSVIELYNGTCHLGSINEWIYVKNIKKIVGFQVQAKVDSVGVPPPVIKVSLHHEKNNFMLKLSRPIPSDNSEHFLFVMDPTELADFELNSSDFKLKCKTVGGKILSTKTISIRFYHVPESLKLHFIGPNTNGGRIMETKFVRGVRRGKSITAVCEVDETKFLVRPPSSILWKLQPTLCNQTQSNDNAPKYKSKKGSIITFEAFEGILTCIAKHSYKTIKKSIRLVLTDTNYAKTFWTSESPVFVSESSIRSRSGSVVPVSNPKVKHFYEGDPLIIACRIRLFHQTNITSSKNINSSVILWKRSTLGDFNYDNEVWLSNVKNSKTWNIERTNSGTCGNKWLDSKLTLLIESSVSQTAIYSCYFGQPFLKHRAYLIESFHIQIHERIDPFIQEYNMTEQTLLPQRSSVIKNVFGLTVSAAENTQKVVKGVTISLRCPIAGSPLPHIKWMKQNVEYEEGSWIVFDRNHSRISITIKAILNSNSSAFSELLTISNINFNDSGRYVCTTLHKEHQLVDQRRRRRRRDTVEDVLKAELNLLVTTKEVLPNTVSNTSLFSLILIPLTFVGSATILFLRNRKIKMLRAKISNLSDAEIDSMLKGAVNINQLSSNLVDQASMMPYDNHLEFSLEKLQIGQCLGTGAFGMVMKAEAIDLLGKEGKTTVAVKTVKRNSEPCHVQALMTELKILKHLGHHANVLQLIGASTSNLKSCQLVLILEYCKNGNIRSYLWQKRKNFVNLLDVSNESIDEYQLRTTLTTRFKTNSNQHYGSFSENFSFEMTPKENNISYDSNSNGFKVSLTNVLNNNNIDKISTTDLLWWSYQIANGMEYIASKEMIHGDLAARNILLNELGVIKIADFGFSRKLYQQVNYVKKKKASCLPIRWMALESLEDNVYSTQSDVWSFGIVLWEIFSLAKIPYPGENMDETFIKRLRGGYRIERPRFAPEKIYDIMLECWNTDPLLRPCFSELKKRLKIFINESQTKILQNLMSFNGLTRRNPNNVNFAKRQWTTGFHQNQQKQDVLSPMANIHGYIIMSSERNELLEKNQNDKLDKEDGEVYLLMNPIREKKSSKSTYSYLSN